MIGKDELGLCVGEGLIRRNFRRVLAKPEKLEKSIFWLILGGSCGMKQQTEIM